jgi:hypothetical protein
LRGRGLLNAELGMRNVELGKGIMSDYYIFDLDPICLRYSIFSMACQGVAHDTFRTES